jgi:hypothetical protein
MSIVFCYFLLGWVGFGVVLVVALPLNPDPHPSPLLGERGWNVMRIVDRHLAGFLGVKWLARRAGVGVLICDWGDWGGLIGFSSL